MHLANIRTRWIAAAVCVLSISQAGQAEDGVIRLSDADSRPAVVKLKQEAPQPPRTSLAPPNARGYYQSAAYSPQDHFAAYASLYGIQQPQSNLQQVSYSASIPDVTQVQYDCLNSGCDTMAGPGMYGGCGMCGSPNCGGCGGYGGMSCGPGGCGPGGCGPGGCGNGCCCGGTGNCDGQCGTCNGQKLKKMPNRQFKKMLKSQRDSSYHTGFQNRVRLLAGATPKDGCNGWLKRYWRGQQLNYVNRNQHLSNALFGWMVPSGCGGQGCPPFGKYSMTYADDPGYTHDQDMIKYGAQGYGTHMSVPLPPTVRYSYNYSWGTPSSRLTQVGSYDPQTSYELPPHRTW